MATAGLHAAADTVAAPLCGAGAVATQAGLRPSGGLGLGLLYLVGEV